ncbi:MAG TPA: D-TA family PLP-dependent enzyme [Puia sp.]|jgi:D-serine deaminase-like pyridoxal phosphate-dependent protein|nr:D-TA family PLP-dependent enzyme [Puia sp.]
MNWYTIQNVDEMDTPALVVYPHRVRSNIQKAIAMVGDVARLRPHVKTHKSAEVTQMMLEAGIGRFKCATIAEAEMLAIQGAPDVLLAYQPIGPKAARMVALINRFPDTRFSCLIDNAGAATAMAAVFAGAGLIVPVWLDINVGMNRTGIAPDEAALQLYQTATALKGITPVGLHAYDGHIRDTDPAVLEQQCDAAFDRVLALRQQIAALLPGSPLLSVIAGGSPTFPVHARRGSDVQCSPGTFVYWDKGYGDQFPGQPFEPAALVVTRVVSVLGDNRYCLDLGHKSIAPENDLGRRVGFLNGPGLEPTGQSEEHLVVKAKDEGAEIRIGDVFYGVPYHVCPTVALYDRAFTVVDGKVTGEWRNVARDRKLTI